jgi:hypothetical protein
MLHQHFARRQISDRGRFPIFTRKDPKSISNPSFCHIAIDKRIEKKLCRGNQFELRIKKLFINCFYRDLIPAAGEKQQYTSQAGRNKA